MNSRTEGRNFSVTGKREKDKEILEGRCPMNELASMFLAELEVKEERRKANFYFPLLVFLFAWLSQSKETDQRVVNPSKTFNSLFGSPMYWAQPTG